MRLVLSEVDLSVGEVVYPPGGALGPRRQRHVQLVLIHAGSASINVDGEHRASLGPGSVGLLLPGHTERFAFAAATPTRHAWIEGAPVGAPLERLARLPPALPASTALTELVAAAVDAARTPLPTGRPLLAALAAAALWRYVGEAESGAGGPGDAVERARRFLHTHLADPGIDLAQAARAAHVTPAHLVRRFRAELGVTPMAYLWQRRVATGIDLLRHTGLPVGDIAARTGFKSVYHFSRRVRAQAGRPPREVRRAHWAGPQARAPANVNGRH
jgi:AraC family transcriptional regulator of arabinose operon